LSKLVEVAAHNMARVRLVWASIWRVMADHFTRVGCGKDIAMAHFAVNALKQLAYQFLDKKELGDFNFQKVWNRTICLVCFFKTFCLLGIFGSFQIHYESCFRLEHSRVSFDVSQQCGRVACTKTAVWLEG
jgi:hypothetical protein